MFSKHPIRITDEIGSKIFGAPIRYLPHAQTPYLISDIFSERYHDLSKGQDVGRKIAKKKISKLSGW